MAKLKIAVMNRHVIRANKKNGVADPPIRLSRGKHGKPTYHSVVEFNGKGRLIYDPANPLPCGATAWLELEDAA